MLEVHYIKVDNGYDVSEETLIALEEGLPDFIKLKIGEKITQKRFCSVLGWKLLQKNTQADLFEIEFLKYGKPQFKNEKLYFNLSNTKNTVVLAIATQPIGVDVELVRKPRTIIYARVFSNREVEYINSFEDKALAFTNMWTRKEAVVKLFGGGLQMGLKNFEVIHNKTLAFDKTVHIQSVKIEDRVSHVATYAPSEIKLVQHNIKDFI